MPVTVQTAIVTLHDDSPGPDGPGAYLPIAGVPMVERLVRRLSDAGIEQLIVLSDAPSRELKRILADFQGGGRSATVLSKASDMHDYIRADSPVLLIENGVLPSPALLDEMTHRTRPIIYTRSVASSDDRHERIDLNDRWAGLAVVEGSLAHGFDDLPDGWNIASALLRRAVQKSVAREPLAISPGSDQRADLVRTLDDARTIEKRLTDALHTQKASSAGGVLRWLGAKLSATVLPRIWAGSFTARQLGIALVIAAAMTMLFSVFSWIVPALVCALVTVVGCETWRDANTLAGRANISRNSAIVRSSLGIVVASAPVALIAVSGLTLAAVAAGLMLPLALFATRTRNRATASLDAASAIIIVAILYALGLNLFSALLAISAATLALSAFGEMAVKGNLTQKS